MRVRLRVFRYVDRQVAKLGAGPAVRIWKNADKVAISLLHNWHIVFHREHGPLWTRVLPAPPGIAHLVGRIGQREPRLSTAGSSGNDVHGNAIATSCCLYRVWEPDAVALRHPVGSRIGLAVCQTDVPSSGV